MRKAVTTHHYNVKLGLTMLKRLINLVLPATHPGSTYKEIEEAICTLASWLEQSPWARNITILLAGVFGLPALLLIPLWHAPSTAAIALAQLVVSMITGIVQVIALLATATVGLYVAGQYKEAHRKRLEDGTSSLQLTIPDTKGISGADRLLLTVDVHLSNKGTGTAQNVQLVAFIDGISSGPVQIGSVRNAFQRLVSFEFISQQKTVTFLQDEAKKTPNIALSMLENIYKTIGPIPQVRIDCTYDHAHMDAMVGRASVSVTYDDNDRLWKPSPPLN